MSILKLRVYPDPVLKEISKPVKGVGDKERKLFNDMAETMYGTKGIGLAAPQVGESIRIIIADIGEGLIKLANPRIIRTKGKISIEEGCLSVPQVNKEIERAEEIEVIALDEFNNKIQIKAKGLLSVVLQHEVDHLNGKLIVDYD